MSLIHNMLKNLENRHTHSNPTLPKRISMYAIKMDEFKHHPFLFLTLFFITFVSVLTWQRHLHHQKMTPMLLEKPYYPESSAIEPRINWLQQSNITGVTLQVKENITELTFLLDHPTLYRLISHDSSNTISLILDKSTITAEIPPVNFLKTAIHHIATHQLKDDTVFDIVLQPGAIIKYANLSIESNHPELTIAFEIPSVSNKPIASNKSEIKSQGLNSILSQQYQSALQIAESGQISEAIEQLSSLLKVDPSYHEARTSLAALLLDQGHLSQAEFIVDEGLTNNVHQSPLIELKARILSMQGKTKQALELLQSYSPPINDNPEYHALLAAMYEQTHDYQLSANLYKELLSISPHNGNWWMGLGIAMDKLGQNKVAIEAYHQAMKEGQLQASSLGYLQSRLSQLQKATDANE